MFLQSLNAWNKYVIRPTTWQFSTQPQARSKQTALRQDRGTSGSSVKPDVPHFIQNIVQRKEDTPRTTSLSKITPRLLPVLLETKVAARDDKTISDHVHLPLEVEHYRWSRYEHPQLRPLPLNRNMIQRRDSTKRFRAKHFSFTAHELNVWFLV